MLDCTVYTDGYYAFTVSLLSVSWFRVYDPVWPRSLEFSGVAASRSRMGRLRLNLMLGSATRVSVADVTRAAKRRSRRSLAGARAYLRHTIGIASAGHRGG